MRAQLLLCVGCVSLLALLHACAAAPAEHNRVTFPKTQQESGTGGDIAVVTVAEHHAVWRALLCRAALPEPKQNARARRHANPEDETFTAVWKSLSDLIMRVVNLGPDPSLVYRPDLPPTDSKDKSEFRNFESGELFDRVFNTYQQMHTHQTLDFVKQKHVEWTGCTHARMSVMEGVSALDQLVDESDPDADFPNSFHAFQTAEGIRQEHPDKDWFQLVGLIHDIGKILALWGEPQWAVVGDTFPVGCKFQNSIVFRDSTFVENPDDKSPTLNSESGIYQPHCGLDNVLMSWGHDEYLYRVMKFNKCLIPEEGLYMIRFHSFYPWHCHGDYMHLCNEKDLRMLPWVKEFNKFDLYTKSTEMPDVEELKPYYQSLISKYCPGDLQW